MPLTYDPSDGAYSLALSDFWPIDGAQVDKCWAPTWSACGCRVMPKPLSGLGANALFPSRPVHC